MREIKFRAWDNLEERMYGNVQTGIYQDPDEIIDFGKILDFACYEIMQYTGLKDKNGKEIYEGDIINYNFKSLLDDEKINRKRTSKVFWQEFRAVWAVADGKCCNSDLFRYVQNGNVVEVIGNIYENPELLEG